MDILDRIQDMMYCELDDMGKKDKLDTKDVELIDKFVDIVKDIDDIISGSQMGGNSYGNRYMGSRYSRGRAGGYSRTNNKDAMLDHLQDVADMAMDEKDRKAVERLISQMAER